MTTSASITGSFDQRDYEANRWPVWEKEITYVWETGDGHAEQKVAVNINGVLLSATMKVSSVTGDPDVTLTIDDNADNEILTVTEDDGATYHYWWLYEPLRGTIDVCIDPSADPGGGTLTVTVYLRGI